MVLLEEKILAYRVFGFQLLANVCGEFVMLIVGLVPIQIGLRQKGDNCSQATFAV